MLRTQRPRPAPQGSEWISSRLTTPGCLAQVGAGERRAGEAEVVQHLQARFSQRSDRIRNQGMCGIRLGFGQGLQTTALQALLLL